MTDAVVQLEGLRKEAIAQAAVQGDAGDVEVVSIGSFVDLPTDDAPLGTAANAVTRYRAAYHYSVAADMCGAGQPKLNELHAVTILLWSARCPFPPRGTLLGCTLRTPLRLGWSVLLGVPWRNPIVAETTASAGYVPDAIGLQ